VAGTAIYSHFETKQELLAEAIREGADRIGAGMRAALAADAPTPAAALENVVRGYVEVVLDNADMNACYVLESRTLPGELRQPMLRYERGLRDTFRAQLMALRPELSREQAQTMVQMAIFSLVALCLHRNRIERDALVELATAQVLGALTSPVPEPNPRTKE